MLLPEEIKEWQSNIPKIIRVGDYHRIKTHIGSIDQQITTLEDECKNLPPPRNPREDGRQLHMKNKLRMLKKQKERLDSKLQTLAKQIETDIQAEKYE